MEPKNLADKIKQLRWERGWSQQELSNRSGVPRSHISLIELGRIKHPGANVFLNLAGAFGIAVEDLYEAAGYSPTTKPEKRKETAEELLERARLAQPISIPIYREFHAGAPREEPEEYIYVSRPRAAGKNIEAYRVHGSCLQPGIGISNGDIVIVDRDLPGEVGDIVLALIDDELYCGRLVEFDNELFLVNQEQQKSLKDCRASAVVIQVEKRLK